MGLQRAGHNLLTEQMTKLIELITISPALTQPTTYKAHRIDHYKPSTHTTHNFMLKCRYFTEYEFVAVF